jgi:polar amino acid transport system substrate-binding protein
MKKIGFALLACVILAAAPLAAETYKVAVPQLAPASTEAYSSLIKAILEATGNTAEVQVLPFARCLFEVEGKTSDIVSSIVAIPDQKKWAGLKFDYSTAESIRIVFVLYTNKNKPIDVAELKKGNPGGYKLETDAAHTEHFNFAIAGSTSFDASLKKVQEGAIDGFLFSQASGDVSLRRLGFKDVRRQYYDTFVGVFPLQKGQRGGKLDKLISEGLAKIKTSGKYQEIMGALIAGASVFIDWQP